MVSRDPNLLPAGWASKRCVMVSAVMFEVGRSIAENRRADIALHIISILSYFPELAAADDSLGV